VVGSLISYREERYRWVNIIKETKGHNGAYP